MPLSPAALEPLLRLALVPGVGPGRLAALVQTFGSADRVLAASPAALRGVPGIGNEVAGRIRAAAAPEAREPVRRALAAMQRAGAVALTPDDLAYPDAFRSLPEAPYLLFVAGDLALLDRPGLGVVGTREPTPYGRESAAALSAAISRAGYLVVSGMARGIDTAAHTAALDAGGGTIGVLGNGIDRIYPTENRALFERVRREGLLLSEFVPGEVPRAGNFPRRNRLIAALSRGVLVVEMGARSGAQHTVNFALEQGKEIFAVPGPIGSPTSAGTNQLIKDGARVVTAAEDILEELEGVGRPAPPVVPTRPPAADKAAGERIVELPPDLPPDEARVAAALTAAARHVDEIAADSALGSSAVLSALLGLELRGVVESLPGKHFRRAQEADR